MYAKLFTSIYQGTLRGNSHGLLVFTNLLAHCDKDGTVDMHPRAIAEEVGLTVDQVRSALVVLESPDDESRSPEEQGRRIVRLDAHRDWGWVVVNYAKYRAIRSEDDRREQNRLAQERWRNKNKPASAEGKPDKPMQRQKQRQKHLKTTALAGGCAFPAEKAPTEEPSEWSKTILECPHRALLALWAEVLPQMPQHTPSMWSGARADALRSRWREAVVENMLATEADGIEYFRRVFHWVAESPFLMGKAHKPGTRPFQVELAWLVKRENWVKTLEGRYHSEAA